MKLVLLMCLVAGPLATLSAQSGEPVMDAWRRNIDSTDGSCPSGNCYPCPLPHVLIETIPADVLSVRYTLTDIYLVSTGIPSHPIGEWAMNPNCAKDKAYVFQIPRFPSPAGPGAHVDTPFGRIGVMVNGVPFFNPKDGMSWMGFGEWFRNAVYWEDVSMDAGLGHPEMDYAYHYHQRPPLLALQEGDNGVDHSPILGFAFDGYPVYGPYGFSHPDGTGGVRRMETSYQIRSITDRSTLSDGTPSMFSFPPIDMNNPLGSYVDDYEYVPGLGDLDKYNGRMCVTPEYPMGTYAYFATIDATGANEYPYVVGRSYFGQVQCNNFEAMECPSGCVCTKPIPTGIPFKPFTLYETNFVGGSVAKVSMGLAGPGDKLYLGVSLTGDGPIGSSIGKIALSPPVFIFGPFTANPAGGLTFTAPLDAALSGITLYLQAFQYDGSTYHLSNPDRVVVL